MLVKTIDKRINNAIKRYIPNESDKVKKYIYSLIKITFKTLRMDAQIDERTNKPYSESKDLHFAISITLDDMDTPMILKEARESK